MARVPPCSAAASRRGTLVLVVGPSGAGKDSLLAGAAARFADDDRIVFAQRVITRPASSSGENHCPVSPAAFRKLRDAGALMLEWQAHDLCYGLPRSLGEALEDGQHVAANVSRSVIVEARRRFPPVQVVAIAATPSNCARRLVARGREGAGEIARRIERGDALRVRADHVIDNDGQLAEAIERFVALLKHIVEDSRAAAAAE